MRSTSRTGFSKLGIRLISLAALSLFPAVASAQAGGFTLFGKPSEEAMSLAPERQFVHPATHPFFHEDSFVTTDLRAWFLYHNFSDVGFPSSVNGGEAFVYALQVRVAITDQLQLVAYKDGYSEINSGVVDESGWNDPAAGIKWNFWQDYKNDFYAAVGVGYQFALGNPGVLQNYQEVRFWGSINKGFGNLHLGGTVNYLKMVGNEGPLGAADRFTFHLHTDYYVCKWFSPLAELNGYFVTEEGREIANFSAVDVGNLGGGSDLITGALGFEVRPTENLYFRVAYETDLTSGDSLFGYRWTFSAIYGF